MKARIVMAFGILALLALASNAAKFLPLSIEQLTDKADVVVHGVVQSKTVVRDAEQRILTRIDVAVSEVWKGSAATNLTLVCAGGTLGEERVAVPGQAEYAIGEEVVAFLVRNGRGEAVTMGLAHGKFHVWQDKRSGEKFARSQFHGGDPQPSGGGEGRNIVSRSDGPLTLGELKRRVRERTP